MMNLSEKLKYKKSKKEFKEKINQTTSNLYKVYVIIDDSSVVGIFDVGNDLDKICDIAFEKTIKCIKYIKHRTKKSYEYKAIIMDVKNSKCSITIIDTANGYFYNKKKFKKELENLC